MFLDDMHQNVFTFIMFWTMDYGLRDKWLGFRAWRGVEYITSV